MKALMFDHKEAGKIAHIEGLNNEYTLCGLAVIDSSINMEGFEWLRHEKEKKPNCQQCIQIVNFCKQIPASALSKSLKNPF